MAPQDALVAELKELEELLLVPDVRKSKRLTELLADEFVEFGSSGRVYAKDDLVAVLQAESPVTQTTSDFKVTSLGHQLTVVTGSFLAPRLVGLAPEATARWSPECRQTEVGTHR